MNCIKYLICCGLLLGAVRSYASEWQVRVAAGASGNNTISGSGLHDNNIFGNNPCYETTEFKNADLGRVTYESVNATWFGSALFGIDCDLSCNMVQLKEQRVRLTAPTISILTNGQGVLIHEPGATLRFYQLYIGPLLRYKRQAGLWSALSPYAGCGGVYNYGEINNTYYAPGQSARYGTEGTSLVSGFAFAAKTGLAYEYRNMILGIECKYVTGTYHADQFRSFNKNGLDISLSYTVLAFTVAQKF